MVVILDKELAKEIQKSVNRKMRYFKRKLMKEVMELISIKSNQEKC